MTELQKFVAWAETNKNIRGVILTGSRANEFAKKDHLSDFDIALFGNSFDFIENDDWLDELHEYWVCIHDGFELLGHEIPTRLVIFNDHLKIDFSFHPVEIINKIISTHELPDGFNLGYKILLDKDTLLRNLPTPANTGFVLKKPSESDYSNNVNEFWFEVFHVAKYLIRNDLWTAKYRDWSSKQFLLQMLQWHHGLKNEHGFSPKPEGRAMTNWADPKIWEKLHLCFGNFDGKNAWSALENTIQLYREVANEVGTLLKYPYNQNLDGNISEFVKFNHHSLT